MRYLFIVAALALSCAASAQQKIQGYDIGVSAYRDIQLRDGKIVIADATDTDAGALVVEQGQFDYEAVAASQTDQVMGATGAVGDFLHKLVIVPATTSPGNVLIEDGTATAITVFTGGASSVGDLTPIVLEFNIRSTSGAWEITTGANVSAIGIGRFTP